VRRFPARASHPNGSGRGNLGDTWWRDAVVYEIYIRSFADADGDGIGDLDGIRDRLGYLELLGVDALWITPFYRSPTAGEGYAIADPRDVDPVFGDLAAFDALLAEAHARGLRVVIDLVPNHTSDAHEWFRAAVSAGPGSRERRRYLFRDGLGPRRDRPPNNWRSTSGGPAWTQADGRQWYLHLSGPGQPDLNWSDADVRADFERTLRFWLDRGVDGVRITTAHRMAKPARLHNMDPQAAPLSLADPRLDDDGGVPEIHRLIRSVLDEYPRAVAVGEIAVADEERAARYLRPDELHASVDLRLGRTRFDADAVRTAIERALALASSTGAPATWALANHDMPRQVSRYGGGAQGARRARAMALVELALPGMVLLYNGEELALPDAGQGQDGARVPLPWQGGEPPFAFSGTARSWLPVPAGWADLTVEAQLEDPRSTLSLYRHALELRHGHPALAGDELEWYGAPAGCFAFRRRGGLICVLNTSATAVDLPPGELLLSSEPLAGERLPADTTAWLYQGV
jgi:alpha-glucosidase